MQRQTVSPLSLLPPVSCLTGCRESTSCFEHTHFWPQDTKSSATQNPHAGFGFTPRSLCYQNPLVRTSTGSRLLIQPWLALNGRKRCEDRIRLLWWKIPRVLCNGKRQEKVRVSIHLFTRLFCSQHHLFLLLFLCVLGCFFSLPVSLG